MATMAAGRRRRTATTAQASGKHGEAALCSIAAVTRLMHRCERPPTAPLPPRRHTAAARGGGCGW
jgi:hypothetical protein